MKFVLSLVAMVALLGFVGFTHAEDAPKPKVHHHKGQLISASSTELVYKGMKANSKEHTVKVDDKTTVTLEGKPAKLSDLKADLYVTLTENEGVITEVAATATAPAHKDKPKSDGTKTGDTKTPARRGQVIRLRRVRTFDNRTCNPARLRAGLRDFLNKPSPSSRHTFTVRCQRFCPPTAI